MSASRPHSAEQRAERKRRVQAAKTALHESSQLQGPHIVAARSALKNFLRQIDDPRQPTDAVFNLLLEAPFTGDRAHQRGVGRGGNR